MFIKSSNVIPDVSIDIAKKSTIINRKAMKHNYIIQYLLKGFSLANRSLDILLIGFLLTITSTILGFLLSNTALEKAQSALSFIFLFIGISFTLSIPIFLLQKQQQKSLNYKELIGILVKNTKRIMLPGILLFILFTILLSLSLVIIAIALRPSENQVAAFFQNFGKDWQGWQLIFLIPIILLSFLEFTPFFFSLENQGLWISIKNSIITAFRNLPYIGLVTLIMIITYSITSFISMGTTQGQLIRNLIAQYVNLVIAASSLFYYQSAIKKDLEV
mgnify:CR=1 FL=1